MERTVVEQSRFCESSSVEMRKTVKRYGGISHLRDERYLKILFEEDKENYLSRLPREVFMKVMYKACAGEQEEYRRLLCKEIHSLPVCPNIGWIRLVTISVDGMLLLKPVYPPIWKLAKNNNFDMIHRMANCGRRTTRCSHCHRVINHHLSVGLSSVIYRLLNPPLGEGTDTDIQLVRMKNVMKVLIEFVVF